VIDRGNALYCKTDKKSSWTNYFPLRKNPDILFKVNYYFVYPFGDKEGMQLK